MANEYLVNSADLTAVADAIRTKGGTSDALTFPGGFVDAVGAIQAGTGGNESSTYLKVIERTLSGDFEDEVITTIGAYSFSNCPVNNLRFKNAEVLKGFAFAETKKLNTIIFDKRIAMSEYFPFQNSTVSKVVFKNGLSSWATLPFHAASSVTSLVFGGEFTSLTGSGFFDPTKIVTGDGYVYVPAALVDTYKGATNWTVYADKIRAIEDYPGIEEF